MLGTLVEIGVADECDDESIQAAIDAAFAAMQRVHELLSYHAADSELSKLNREAANRALRVDPHTYRVLQAALRMATMSEGAFDPCVAPHLEAWGYLPSAGAPPLSTDWRDIELTDGRVRFARPLRIDLGGIAKGYAVDAAVTVLQSAGLDGFIVNAGGDLRVMGRHPECVQLRHPDDPSRIAHSLLLQNAALATSAAYYSRALAGGKEVSALVDPRTGEPHLSPRSVSVRAGDCMTADALTKVIMFAPAALAERCLAAADAEAYVLDGTPSNRAIC